MNKFDRVLDYEYMGHEVDDEEVEDVRDWLMSALPTHKNPSVKR